MLSLNWLIAWLWLVAFVAYFVNRSVLRRWSTGRNGSLMTTIVVAVLLANLLTDIVSHSIIALTGMALDQREVVGYFVGPFMFLCVSLPIGIVCGQLGRPRLAGQDAGRQ